VSQDNLQAQLAHLSQRIQQVKSLPALARVAYVDELLSLQLSLLGSMVDAVTDLEAQQRVQGLRSTEGRR